MSGGNDSRASRVSLDGALVRSQLPGYEGVSERNADQAPIIFQSGIMTYATDADANNGRALAPCDLEIMGAVIGVDTAVNATGDSGVDIGNNADDDAYLSGYLVATTIAANGLVSLSATQFVTTSIEKGAIIEFGLDVATTAGGVVFCALVTAPR